MTAPLPNRQLEVFTLDDRQRARVRVDAIAAVVTLKEGGPARLLFSGGGHLDVCGSSDYWSLRVRMAELVDARDQAASE